MFRNNGIESGTLRSYPWYVMVESRRGSSDRVSIVGFKSNAAFGPGTSYPAAWNIDLTEYPQLTAYGCILAGNCFWLKTGFIAVASIIRSNWIALIFLEFKSYVIVVFLFDDSKVSAGWIASNLKETECLFGWDEWRKRVEEGLSYQPSAISYQ